MSCRSTGRPRTAARARAGASILVGLLMSLALVMGPAGAARAGEEQVEGVCALADDLNEQHRPQDARALLDEHRAAENSHRTDCATEYFEAQARTSLATVVSTLEDDEELESLRTQLTTVCDAPADADTRSEAAAACDVALSPEPPGTWSERAGSAVDTFVERWANPLGPLALAVVGFLAAIYVLARLWSRWVVPGALAHVSPAREPRTAAVVDTVTVTALATSAFVLLLTRAPAATDPAPVVVVVAGVTLALGLWAARLLAPFLASALRISVIARGPDGTESPTAAGHVIGLLNELGARPPQGAQYPSGTDVSALDTAVISALPTGAVAKALIGVVHVFLPRAPWEVSVDEESVDRETVQVRHNGRLVSAAVVDRDLLGLRTTAETAAASGDASASLGTAMVVPDLHRLSAAIVLAELHKVHRLPGLGGATDGTSIGLQAVATTDLARDYDAAVPLLARAVGADSGNLAATLALLHHRFRDATTTAELTLYDAELARLLDRLKALEQDDPTGHVLLSSRARLNQLVARINTAYAKDDGATRSQVLESARALANELLTDVSGQITAATTPPESLNVLRAIHRNASILAVVGKGGDVPVPPQTPLEHHQTACHYASAPTPDDDRAVHHLRVAGADPRLATWRASDPQLARLRRTDAYRAAFPPEKARFFSLPGLAHLEDELTRLGVTSERDLLAHHPAELARLLGLTGTTTTRLIALARLASQVPADLHAWRFTIATWVADAAPTTTATLAESAEGELAENLDTGQITTLKAWVEGGGLTRQSAVKDYLRAVS